jgi:hypothetical protein
VTSPKDRVLRVVRAARAVVARGEDELAGAIAASAGLSIEGALLALREYLEVKPSEEEIDCLVARASSAPRCHVLLSANVCTAALRALACAAAVSGEVFVRPSSRDRVLADRLVGELGAPFQLVEALAPEPGDEVHAYGRDETLGALTLGARVRLRAFGSGFGVALPGADVAREAAALANDVVVFDQRGCLSPRVALVAPDRADAFVDALAGALAEAARQVPRGPLDEGDRRELARWAATASALGRVSVGDGFAVGLAEEPDAPLIPPPLRVVHVLPCESIGPRVAALVGRATALGGEGELFEQARILAPRARATALGRMQKPPLDGPVDLRNAANSNPPGFESRST